MLDKHRTYVLNEEKEEERRGRRDIAGNLGLRTKRENMEGSKKGRKEIRFG